jgi:dipeptidyl aminopeptidase/acylaminoacyl peptidase
MVDRPGQPATPCVMRHLPLLVALLLSVAALGAVEIVPVEKFVQDSALSQARLSPDGRFIACLQEYEGKHWLVILNLETKKNARVDPGVTVAGLRKEVSTFRWISDRRISFLTTVFDGEAFTGVSAVDCDGKNWVAFTGSDVNPYEQNPLLATQIIHSFGDKEQNVLMLDRGSNEGKDLVYPDVLKISTLSRYAETVVKNPGNVVGWVPDRAGVIRLGITRSGLRFGVIYRENEQARWRTMPLIDEARGRIIPLGFDYDGRKLIVTANNEQKRRAVYYYDLEQGRLGEMIASHEKFDIIPETGVATIDGVSLSGPVLSELAQSVVGIRFITEGPRTLWLDPSFEALQAGLDDLLKDTINVIVSRSKDEKRFLVLAFSDRNPGMYYLVDLKGDKPVVSRLGERLTGFPVAAMAPMYPVKYPARDGEVIHGYLTLPAGEKKTGLPFIVMPHGGPTVRDIWECNTWVQFLANRGYAVLQMNYRGSPGYGTEFYEKGRREIGRGMQDDIEDGTRWAIAKGFADPGRIAIVGGSYGGYSTLFALAHNPELYRCGISIAGVTDWADIIKERKGEEYKFAFLHWREWIGDPKHDAAFLASISPVNFADKITAPVFIIQGKEDRTVPPKQARKMVDALEKAGRPPQVLYFSGEGHGFRQEKNRVKLLTEMEKFLARNLGPRATGP